MASATKSLGFGITASTTYESSPYALARKFSTLDHITRGRVGWNIVTSFLDSAAKAFGFDEQIPHDERYARADEYMELAYKLWEGTWQDDAVQKNPESKVYSDPAKVRRIEHQGYVAYFPFSAVTLKQRDDVLFPPFLKLRCQKSYNNTLIENTSRVLLQASCPLQSSALLFSSRLGHPRKCIHS